MSAKRELHGRGIGCRGPSTALRPCDGQSRWQRSSRRLGKNGGSGILKAEGGMLQDERTVLDNSYAESNVSFPVEKFARRHMR